jgi:hypothetical protein
MKWFRKHVKTGSRLALFALAIQFVLSFGHFHGAAAQTVRIGLTDADLSIATTLAPQAADTETARQPQPSNHDTDQHPADACAICAVASLASNGLFSTPPVLLLPQAVELLYLTTNAEFAHLNAVHPAFQSRAPPAS